MNKHCSVARWLEDEPPYRRAWARGIQTGSHERKYSIREMGKPGRSKTQGNNGNAIKHFTFPDVLPDGCVVAVHLERGTVNTMIVEDGHPRIIGEVGLTGSELTSIIPIFESFPHYCPNEALYATYYHRQVTEENIAASRKYLQEARENGIYDVEFRPVRDNISRARLKLRTIGIDIGSLLSRGYILVARED